MPPLKSLMAAWVFSTYFTLGEVREVREVREEVEELREVSPVVGAHPGGVESLGQPLDPLIP